MKVAFPVVKKLPVVFNGKISTKNNKAKGAIKPLFLKAVLKTYFFTIEI